MFFSSLNSLFNTMIDRYVHVDTGSSSSKVNKPLAVKTQIIQIIGFTKQEAKLRVLCIDITRRKPNFHKTLMKFKT